MRFSLVVSELPNDRVTIWFTLHAAISTDSAVALEHLEGREDDGADVLIADIGKASRFWTDEKRASFGLDALYPRPVDRPYTTAYNIRSDLEATLDRCAIRIP